MKIVMASCERNKFTVEILYLILSGIRKRKELRCSDWVVFFDKGSEWIVGYHPIQQLEQ